MTRNEAIKQANALRQQHARRKMLVTTTAQQRSYLKRSQSILFNQIEELREKYDITDTEMLATEIDRMGDTK